MVLDRQHFLATLPRKRIAAGALIRDRARRICVVEPTYKPLWAFPGGTVEAYESPSAGCEREVLEELGLTIRLGRLLCIDWVQEEGDPDGGLVLIYDGGVLPPDRVSEIVLPLDELSAFQFVHPQELTQLISPVNQHRVERALTALNLGYVVEVDRERSWPASGQPNP